MGNKIRELRTNENLTLEYISYVGKISISYLYQLETGRKNNPSYEVMKRISKALKRPLKDVFFE